MPYLTVDALKDSIGLDRLIEISNLEDAQAGEVNVVRVQANIDQVTGEIDSYLARRYDLPLTTVPLVLTGKAKDMVVYYLLLGIGQVTDDIYNAYKDAVRWLQQVASGLVDLGLATAEEPANTDKPGIGKRAKLFNNDSLRSF